MRYVVLTVLWGMIFTAFPAHSFAYRDIWQPEEILGHFSEEDAVALCAECSTAERSALQRLYNAEGKAIQSSNGGAVYDFGVAIQSDCLTAFGDSFPLSVQKALAQGLMCLGNFSSKTSSRLTQELATVLGAPLLPQVLCLPLSGDAMKGLALRSHSPDTPPRIVISPVLARRPVQEIQGIIFHEFIHLAGDGYFHGAGREVATPCQYCCFKAAPFADLTRKQACNVCVNDYKTDYASEYMEDLEAWALATPGNEHFFRTTLLHGVHHAEGNTAWLLELLNHYKGHPFGFQLARRLEKAFSWDAEQEKAVRRVARKRHGHVTKRYVALADTISDLLLLSFHRTRQGAVPVTSFLPSETTQEAIRKAEQEAEPGEKEQLKRKRADTLSPTTSGPFASETALLMQSRLPDTASVAKRDLPIFFKYYYEFALMRGVFVQEVQDYWEARHTALCTSKEAVPASIAPDRGVVGQGMAGEGADRHGFCTEAALYREVFACQRMGLDYDFSAGQCLKGAGK